MRDLGRKCARLCGGLGALHAGGGKVVLLGAGEAVLGGAVFAKSAHAATGFVGVFQTVKHHMVINLVVAHAVAATALEHEVRRVGHAFHATGHQHVVRACDQHVVREHGRAHARAAHLGQRDRARALGQTALEARLARRRLALACHQAIAKQHFADQLGADACALNGCADGGTTQVVGGQCRKVALEAAHGGARCADDDDGIRHGFLQKIERKLYFALRAQRKK